VNAAKELVEAASTLGFVFIEGSGFTDKQVEEIFELSRRFFDLTVEEKKAIPIDESNYGYSELNLEVLDRENQPKGDPKEAFNFSQFFNEQPLHELPQFFKENKEQLVEFQAKCHELCLKLLKLLGKGLQIDQVQGGDSWFTDRHSPDGKSGSVLRFLHYLGQKSANPEEQIRAGAHTDYGSLTLLFQKQGEDGLEILSPVSKQWTPVPFLPATKPGFSPPIIINIGDLLSFWTAGILKSSVHRVKFPAEIQQTGKDRYSIVYFCHPLEDTLLVPVPSPIVQAVQGRGANAAQSRTLTSSEHLANRLAKSYGWRK
jgi:isopenicillin N synthase-like dioxygenase